jgi:hypothetical protein
VVVAIMRRLPGLPGLPRGEAGLGPPIVTVVV